MMNTHSKARRRFGGFVVAALAAAGSLVAVTTQLATAATDVYLCAKPGSASVADPNGGPGAMLTVPFYGFAPAASELDCGGAVPMLGDPTPLRMTVGETYNLHVVNSTGFAINFSAPGLTGVPDLDGVGDGVSKVYSFTPTTPGTYLYESDFDPRHTMLGLAGVIVVDPVVGGSAHGTDVSQYDVEQVVVISEVDTALNGALDPFAVSMLDIEPDLFLLNGQTHTANSSIPPVVATGGDRLLVRYVNAGVTNSSMGVLGLRQSQVAFDGEIFEGTPGVAGETPQDVSMVFLSAGQTADSIVTVGGAIGDQIPIYNRNLRTTATGDNGTQLMMIEVGAGGIRPGANIYLSFDSGNRIYNGVRVRDEDVALWDGTTLSVYFDGSAHGLGGQDVAGTSADIDAVHVAPSGNLYFSLRVDTPNPGTAEWAGVADAVLQDNDVFRWDGTSFAVWLDGSLIGLLPNQNRHDINAIHVDEVTGVTSFSTNGTIKLTDGVPLMTGMTSTFGARNEDIIQRIPALPTSPSGAGRFEILSDGQDFGLGMENLDGLALAGADVLFSLTTEFPNTPNPDFDRDDLIGCLGFQQHAPGTTVDTCAAPLSLEFDADILHATNAGQVDGYSIG